MKSTGWRKWAIRGLVAVHRVKEGCIERAEREEEKRAHEEESKNYRFLTQGKTNLYFLRLRRSILGTLHTNHS